MVSFTKLRDLIYDDCMISLTVVVCAAPTVFRLDVSDQLGVTELVLEKCSENIAVLDTSVGTAECHTSR